VPLDYGRVVSAGGGAGQEHAAFALVAGEGGGALELLAGLAVAAELGEEVAADGRELGVAIEGSLVQQGVGDLQPLGRAGGHPDRDRAVQLNDRRGCDVGEHPVERGDAPPVGVLGRERAGVAGGDLGLQGVGAEGAERVGAGERLQAAAIGDITSTTSRRNWRLASETLVSRAPGPPCATAWSSDRPPRATIPSAFVSPGPWVA
jgi:hypothetical protein